MIDVDSICRKMQLPKPPPSPGDRVIINRWENFTIKVIAYLWVESESRFKIYLDWGMYGNSYVYSDDEGDVWRRYLSTN